jgi:NAD(P)-dependent dehydrogenase (short-subunit alcohol dehydrogenase family)
MMLKDKVVMITGAAGRVGASAAQAVIDEGGVVVLVDVDEDRLSALAGRLPAEQILVLNGNPLVPDEADRLLSEIKEYFSVIDGIIHSAYPRSEGWGTAFENVTPEYLFEDLSNHLGGAILFSQRALRFFKKQGHGNLIHVSSVQGLCAPKFEHYDGTSMVSPIEYSAIKSGLISVTRYLAKYYQGMNIRVNCISPGGIRDKQPDVFLQKYRASCNDKGMLDAEDLDGSIVYLLSDYSRYVTGQNIVVDDGWSL